MTAIGKAATGALTAAFDDTTGQFRIRTVGAASSSVSVGRDINWILSQVVDDDGYLRVVSV